MSVKMLEVESSMIKAIGYDVATKDVIVEFTGGSKYAYNDVPVEEYDKLLNASSIGKHLNTDFKTTYSYNKL